MWPPSTKHPASYRTTMSYIVFYAAQSFKTDPLISLVFYSLISLLTNICAFLFFAILGLIGLIVTISFDFDFGNFWRIVEFNFGNFGRIFEFDRRKFCLIFNFCSSDFIVPPPDLETGGKESTGKESEENPQDSVFNPSPNKNPNTY